MGSAYEGSCALDMTTIIFQILWMHTHGPSEWIGAVGRLSPGGDE